jgi:hypothetical protein
LTSTGNVAPQDLKAREQGMALRSLVVAVALALPLPGAAAERLSAAYAVSWLGLEIGVVEVEVEQESQRYDIAFAARSTGFLGAVFPYASNVRSDGARLGAAVRPRLYEGGSRRGEEERVWSIGFAPDGRAVRIDVPAADLAEREPVPGPLRVGPDPLALALEAIGRAGPGIAADGHSFDGRRALRLELACGDELPVPAAATADPEPTLLCAVDGELVAGASRRWKGRDGRDEKREPVRAWLARGVAPEGWWPVLIEAETRWGTVTVRMTSAAKSPDAS